MNATLPCPCPGLRTELTYKSYVLTFEKDRYLSMVRDRYMSLLTSFNDSEIERGITELRDRSPADRYCSPTGSPSSSESESGQ